MSPSWEHDTIHVPSRLKSTPVTGSECAGNVETQSPLLTSHNLTVSSNDPLTSKLDWGLNATVKTKLEWPRNSTHASPVLASHSRMVLSSDAVATCSAVLDHATSLTPRECPISVTEGVTCRELGAFGAGWMRGVRSSMEWVISQILAVPSADADATTAAVPVRRRADPYPTVVSKKGEVGDVGANATEEMARLCSP